MLEIAFAPIDGIVGAIKLVAKTLVAAMMSMSSHERRGAIVGRNEIDAGASGAHRKMPMAYDAISHLLVLMKAVMAESSSRMRFMMLPSLYSSARWLGVAE